MMENTYQLNIQNKKRSKYYNQEIVLHFIPNPINYFPSFRTGIFHPYAGDLDINVNTSGVVDYCELSYMKVKRIIKLKEFYTFNLEVTAPNKLNLKL